MGPVHILVETPHPPVTPEGVVAQAERVQVIYRVPGPHLFAPGGELNHGVGHDHGILARGAGVRVAAVIVFHQVAVGGEGQEIAVGHLVRLVVQGLLALDGDRVRVLGGRKRPVPCVELPDGIAQQVDLNGGKICPVHKDVAVQQASYAGGAVFGVVIPDDVAFGVERRKDAPILGKPALFRRQPVGPAGGAPAHAQERDARLHEFRAGNLDVEGRDFQGVFRQWRSPVGKLVRFRCAVRRVQFQGNSVFPVRPHADDWNLVRTIPDYGIIEVCRPGIDPIGDRQFAVDARTGIEADDRGKRDTATRIGLQFRRTGNTGHSGGLATRDSTTGIRLGAGRYYERNENR